VPPVAPEVAPYTHGMADGRLDRRAWVQQSLIDRGVVGGLIAIDVTAQVVARGDDGVASAPMGVAAVVCAVLSAVVLLGRRSRPITTLVACGIAAVVCAAIVPPGLFTQQTGITIILSAYAIGAWSDKRVASVAVPLAVLALLVLGVRDDGSDLVQALTVGLAAVALPWMAGRAARSRRRYVEEVERRLVAAEAERDERARRAVRDERTHIARELHDVVAHHVSLIGVQAGAARTSLDHSPEATRSALLAIEESSRTAVGEMGTLLGALRDDEGTGDRSPLPSITDLGELVAGFRAAGLGVDLTVSGDRDLPPALGLVCYRIVEESLTNVTRHSAARTAAVTIVAGAEEVRVTVADAGPSSGSPAGTGRGLVGLAERVALFGGHHHAGPTPDGGFAVVVTLPRALP
jgi:signal transduction histidine kinase